MKMLARAALALSASLTCAAPAAAQHATTSAAPAGYAPEMAVVTVPARSIAATGSVTSSGVTSTAEAGAGAPVFAGGVATIPFTSQLGSPVRLILRGGAAFTASVGTSTDSCATVNTLTAGGSPITYSGSVNEYVDVPPTTASAIAYCLVIAVTSGTETYAVRN